MSSNVNQAMTAHGTMHISQLHRGLNLNMQYQRACKDLAGDRRSSRCAQPLLISYDETSEPSASHVSLLAMTHADRKQWTAFLHFVLQ